MFLLTGWGGVFRAAAVEDLYLGISLGIWVFEEFIDLWFRSLDGTFIGSYVELSCLKVGAEGPRDLLVKGRS